MLVLQTLIFGPRHGHGIARRGEMLLIQNKRVNWETHQVGIPAATAKDFSCRRLILKGA